jgi:hypothetical protein
MEERTIAVDSENKCMYLLPLLELDSVEFFEFLKHAQQRFPQVAESIKNFPKIWLLKHAFHNSVSAYWPERALNWLEKDAALRPFLKEELETFVVNKIMPQQARQRAKRMTHGFSLVI